MVGCIINKSMICENIDMSSTTLFRDEIATFPSARSRFDIEARRDFCTLRSHPALPVGRLLDFKFGSTLVFEVPCGIVRTAPPPFRFERQSNHRFNNMPSKYIVYQWLSENSVTYFLDDIGSSVFKFFWHWFRNTCDDRSQIPHPAGFNTVQAFPIFEALAQLFFAITSEKPEIITL